MVEQWLDSNALSILNASNQSNEEQQEEVQEEQLQIPKRYNIALLDVQLPCSTDIEQISYIPPNINTHSQLNPSSSLLPDFIKPSNSFDIFEHFSYETIPLPL